MKVVSKKRLMKQFGFFREFLKLPVFSVSGQELPMKQAVFNSRSAALPGVKSPAGAVVQSHVAPGEDLQGDRHPEEAGPSQRGQAGGGQGKKNYQYQKICLKIIYL